MERLGYILLEQHLWGIGEVQRYTHQWIAHKITTKEWKTTLFNEILSS
jgi:hypothetical protein